MHIGIQLSLGVVFLKWRPCAISKLRLSAVLTYTCAHSFLISVISMMRLFAFACHQGLRTQVATTSIASPFVHASQPTCPCREEQCASPLLPKRGLVASCPIPTCMAKIFLWDVVAQPVNRQLPSSTSIWVDDLGMDAVGRRVEDTAKRMSVC